MSNESVDREYDPDTCITAGGLRAIGAKLPKGIPKCAWIPRDALRVTKMDYNSVGPKKLDCTIRMDIMEPFRLNEAVYDSETGVADVWGQSE